MTIVILSGGFDPLHSGHLNMIDAASQRGSVVILLNSNDWLTRKKGKSFMTFDERSDILRHLTGVTHVFPVDDTDGTVVKGLDNIKNMFPSEHLIFANGGDRQFENTPEVSFCESEGIQLWWNCGGTKAQSSSDLLKSWTEEICKRPWGTWSVLKEYKKVKVKELLIEPHSQMRMQKHLYRNEVWHMVEGAVKVLPQEKILDVGDTHIVLTCEWHQICNPYNQKARIIEIQYGDKCDELDIIVKDEKNEKI